MFQPQAVRLGLDRYPLSSAAAIHLWRRLGEPVLRLSARLPQRVDAVTPEGGALRWALSPLALSLFPLFLQAAQRWLAR